jgi:hypothetical protein
MARALSHSPRLLPPPTGATPGRLAPGSLLVMGIPHRPTTVELRGPRVAAHVVLLGLLMFRLCGVPAPEHRRCVARERRQRPATGDRLHGVAAPAHPGLHRSDPLSRLPLRCSRTLHGKYCQIRGILNRLHGETTRRVEGTPCGLGREWVVYLDDAKKPEKRPKRVGQVMQLLARQHVRGPFRD